MFNGALTKEDDVANVKRVFDGFKFVDLPEGDGAHSYHDCPFLDSTGELCDDCRVDLASDVADRNYDAWRDK